MQQLSAKELQIIDGPRWNKIMKIALEAFSESKQPDIWQHPRQHIIEKNTSSPKPTKHIFSKTCLSEGRQTRATVQRKNLGLDGTWLCNIKFSLFYSIEGNRCMNTSAIYQALANIQDAAA